MRVIFNKNGIDVRTVGDSRGYLWKISIDKNRGIGRIEKLTGLRDQNTRIHASIDGTEYPLQPDSTIRDDMQHLTSMIESRFQVA